MTFGEVDFGGGDAGHAAANPIGVETSLGGGASAAPGPASAARGGDGPRLGAPVRACASDRSTGPRRRSYGKLIAGGVLIAVVLGGAALQLTPLRRVRLPAIGDDRSTPATTRARRRRPSATPRRRMAVDTYDAAKAAVDAAVRRPRRGRPRARPLTAYAALVDAAVAARFGADTCAHVAREAARSRSCLPARQVKYQDVAAAAQSAADGDLDKARRALDAAGKRDTGDPIQIEVALLRGDVELAAPRRGGGAGRLQATRWSSRTTPAPTTGWRGPTTSRATRPTRARSSRPRWRRRRSTPGRSRCARAWHGASTRHRRWPTSRRCSTGRDAPRPRPTSCRARTPRAAWSHLDHGAASEARDAFAQAVKVNPRNVEALNGEGRLLLSEGRLHRGARALRHRAPVRSGRPRDHRQRRRGEDRPRAPRRREAAAARREPKLPEEHRRSCSCSARWSSTSATTTRRRRRSARRCRSSTPRGPTRCCRTSRSRSCSSARGTPRRRARRRSRTRRRSSPPSATLERALRRGRRAAGRLRRRDRALPGGAREGREGRGDATSSSGWRSGGCASSTRRARSSIGWSRSTRTTPGCRSSAVSSSRSRATSRRRSSSSRARSPRRPTTPTCSSASGARTSRSTGPTTRCRCSARCSRSARRAPRRITTSAGPSCSRGGASRRDALRYLKRAVELDPNRAEYHVYLAWAANDATPAQLELARDEIDKALALDKLNADAYWQTRRARADAGGGRGRGQGREARPRRCARRATRRTRRWPSVTRTRTTRRTPLAEWTKAIAGDGTRRRRRHGAARVLALPLRQAPHGQRQRGGRARPAPARGIAAEKLEPRPGWLAPRRVPGRRGAAQGRGSKADAVEHYRRFLEIAPVNSPDRADAKAALTRLRGRTPAVTTPVPTSVGSSSSAIRANASTSSVSPRASSETPARRRGLERGGVAARGATRRCAASCAAPRRRLARAPGTLPVSRRPRRTERDELDDGAGHLGRRMERARRRAQHAATSNAARTKTVSAPHALVPGSATRRSATSSCTMKTTRSTRRPRSPPRAAAAAR